jgi:rSAM/selenodomain-associated transferase 1
MIAGRSTGETIVVFAKHPGAGSVKTRLAAAIGPRAAARVYRRLALACCDAAREAASAGRRLVVQIDPADRVVDAPSWIGSGLTFEAQSGADLGERMSSAFEHQFELGAQAVVLVGSDCPELSAGDFDHAFDALQRVPVVLGPALDGGYWLIGLRAPAPGLFSGIEWSSPTVLAETRRRTEEQGLAREELRLLRDIDTIDDLLALEGRLPQGVRELLAPRSSDGAD